MVAGPIVIDRVVGVAQTTDATVTSVISYTMTAGTTALWIAKLTGRDGAGNCASASQQGGAKQIAGTASITGTIVTLATFATTSSTTLATCTITVDTSGATIRLRVNGIIATTIDWIGSIEVVVS